MFSLVQPLCELPLAFVDLETGTAVFEAALVVMSGKTVYYVGYEARVGPCYCGAFEGDAMPDSHSIAVCAP